MDPELGGFAFDKFLCLSRLAHKVMTRLGYSEQQIQVCHFDCEKF
jgi:hypothetical protein